MLSSKSAIVEALAAYFEGLHTCDVERFKHCWHPSGELYGVGPKGTLVTRDAAAFFEGIAARDKSPELVKHDKILSIIQLDDCTSAAKVQIALPPAPGSPVPSFTNVLYTDFLVLLKDADLGWKIISKVFSPEPLAESATTTKKITPEDFAEVAQAAAQYLEAGRALDGAGMAKVFHAASRLTFSLNGKIVIISCPEFCERVENRWEMDIHKPWAHLKDDSRIGLADTLTSIDFAGPGVALVTLKVGYPPFLYTDFLSFCKLQDEDGKSTWWIAAKSSCNVPFLADEAK